MDVNYGMTAPGMKWYQIWWYVWTHPSAETFRTILRDPGAGSKRGFIWIGVTSIITTLISLLSFGTSSGFLRETELYIIILCLIVLTPLFAVIGLAISAGIYRLIAGLFGGSGTWSNLVYSIATISAPASLLAIPGALLGVFNTINTTEIVLLPSCFVQLIGFAVGIYTLVLFVCAIDGVENIGTGKAVLTYFIPVIVLFALGICLFSIGVLPVILEALQQYNY